MTLSLLKTGCELIMPYVLRVAREYQDHPRVSCSHALLVVQNRNSLLVVPAKMDGVRSSQQSVGDGVCFSPRVWIVILYEE